MSFVAFGLYLASWMASAPPFAIQLVAAPDAQVAGRVIDAVSRAPIAGATVMLVPLTQRLPSSPVPRGTLTDAEGNFIFPRLVPGRYHIVARTTEQTIDIAAGQSLTDVELAVQPPAVIAGRIVDSTGEPVSNATVDALRQQTGPDGLAPAITPERVQTNDGGEFRLEGLTGGNYLLLAAPLPSYLSAETATPAMASAPTYYPGTPDKETAGVITVVSGQTIDHLQFSMLMLPSHEVSGLVVDEAGSPVARVFVVLMADSATGGPGRPATGQTDENGAFRFGGIVSGTYRLLAETRGRQVVRIGGSLGATAPRQIVVGDTDVTGLRLVLPAVPLAGPAKPIASPVRPTVQFETAKILGLTILPDVREIKAGDTIEFRMELQLSPGAPPKIVPPPPEIGTYPKVWEANNPAVAAVTRDGSLTALAPGEVTLSVHYLGMSATRMLRVIP